MSTLPKQPLGHLAPVNLALLLVMNNIRKKSIQDNSGS